jgi:predicted RNase H-like HicB family nuclease
MKLKVVIHEAEEGGFWPEVPAIPGCATQGDSFEELLANLYAVIEGYLSIDLSTLEASETSRIMEIAI